MKANELRIGNIVYNEKNEIYKVEWLTGQIENQINPIPITKEWLLKFGFEKYAHSWSNDIFHLSEWDDFPLNWCVAMNKNNAILVLRLKYIHQLQNLYFALTGEELIINQMTAQEKAKQLIEDFGSLESTTYHDGYPETTSIESIYLSKQCALIAVDEILELLSEIAFGNRVIKFYEEVKQEILTYGGNK